VFVAGIAAHLVVIVYLAYTQPARRTQLAMETGLVAGMGVLITIPTFGQILNLLGRTDELAFSSVPSATQLLDVLAIPILVVPAIGIAFIASSMSRHTFEPPLRVAGLVAAGLLTPILILFGLAQVTDVILWNSRYQLTVMPFAAIVFAFVVTRLGSATVAKWTAIAILAAIGASPSAAIEDWRTGIEAADRSSSTNSVLVLGSGLIEAQSVSFFSEPENQSYLSSVVEYYETPHEVVLLPIITSVDADRTLLKAAIATAAETDEIVYVGRTSAGSVPVTILH
jgi:hypothetical protein